MKINSVYFFIADHVKIYEDSLIYIAEGLNELGIPFYSNKNFWITESNNPTFLFNNDPKVSYDDCDLVILSYTWFEYIDHITYQRYEAPFPHFLFTKNRKYAVVYLDPTDGYKTRSWDEDFRMFDLVLRAKYNKYTHNPENSRPWVLGFTNRIISATKNFSDLNERESVVLQNFNFSHPYEHGIRKLAKKLILPKINEKIPVRTTKSDSNQTLDAYDRLMWEQTGNKHDPSYYHSLKTSFAIAAFCGELIPYYPNDPTCYLIGGNKALFKKKMYALSSSLLGKTQRIIQWDSWRFWESLCAGCIPIHLDLEKYGVEIPVMPENWKHYIGLDLDNLNDDIDRIVSDPEINKIGLEGHHWAIKNYSQKQSALRLINYISND